MDVPEPFDIHELCRRLGDARGRPIRLMPVAIGAKGPYGVWIASATTDYIFVEQNTTPYHRLLIILHEIGHLYRGHRGLAEHGGDATRALFPDLDPNTVRMMLGRTAYDDVQEREAELIASLILSKVSDLSPEPDLPVDPEVAELLARIQRSLQHPGARRTHP
jgi:Zn-dependent peptidase ImmA (M78 family)